MKYHRYIWTLLLYWSMFQVMENVHRQYNRLVADESLEDYSLRYAPRSYRKWSEFLIANTALGSISFLLLEVIGASIAITYGFSTAFWAILTASIIIFLTAVPISYYAARYNIDIDLITRSSGFGYVGSTITSLIYASFSFIFFALEAAIMAQALELYFAIPLWFGYLLCSIVIVPLVFYGITLINKLQLWTQPIWLIMMIAPFIAVLLKEPLALEELTAMSGTVSGNASFNIYYFGIAVGVSLSLIAQIGEQVDYLRFMPPLTRENRLRWWFSLLLAGPGWVIIGFLKQMGGILLAAVVLLSGMSLYEAKTPVEMYRVAYQYLFDSPEIALACATFFVIISQIKINVTNAYAGSLAWSNFFSRVTHSHPGRVVWMLFNISIALLLMELGVFDVLEQVLGLYSNIAIAWIGAITADMLINKPLGLSPGQAEFKRAHLYNVNPVGVGSMGIASVVSIFSFVGLFGVWAQSFSALIALFTAFLLTPLIAWYTAGRYYIARDNTVLDAKQEILTCELCNNQYEHPDMSYCPFYHQNICSLCCSLDAVCHDRCKHEQEISFRKKIARGVNRIFANHLSQTTALRIFDFLVLNALMLFIIFIVLWLVYANTVVYLELDDKIFVRDAFVALFLVIAILTTVLVWWILLTHESRKRAEAELQQQNKELEASRETILYQAQHDALTQLPNRKLFNEHLAEAIIKADRSQKSFALFFIDLDRFKQINDSIGHHIGDQVLQAVSTRLLSVIRRSDTLARWGGDEFTLLMEDLSKGQDAAILAEKILQILAEPLLIEEYTLYVTSSIGISLYPKDGREPRELLMYADAAMYKAKDEGKNNFQFYSKDMTDLAYERITLEGQLREALQKQQFVVYFQPQIQATKQQLSGMEALTRWQHPHQGMMVPEKFIPLAEETGLIVALDQWVMEAAMAQFAQWYRQGLQPGVLSLNLSVKQLYDRKFVGHLQHLLEQYQFQSHWLEFEITESVIMANPQEAIKSLQHLCDKGIRLSVDDFGTGYSSLSYLKKLPIDKLKIDKSFIQDLPDDEEDAAITRAIIALAKSLNLSVVAEGVETVEQRQFLLDNGCENIQGYLYCKPISASLMEKYLQKGELRL